MEDSMYEKKVTINRDTVIKLINSSGRLREKIPIGSSLTFSGNGKFVFQWDVRLRGA